MASIVVTVVDQQDQGNYSAGCVFKAFCQYWHALGLPVTVLNICPIGDMAYVAVNSSVHKKLKAQVIFSWGNGTVGGQKFRVIHQGHTKTHLF